MTEKRFTLKHIQEQHLSANLYDNGTFIGSIGIGAELIVELLNTLSDENEQLKKENSVFEGKDAKHYQRWVNQIKKYVEEDNPDFTYYDDFIIKIALSYTLQSVRNGENLKRFQWELKE